MKMEVFLEDSGGGKHDITRRTREASRADRTTRGGGQRLGGGEIGRRSLTRPVGKSILRCGGGGFGRKVILELVGDDDGPREEVTVRRGRLKSKHVSEADPGPDFRRKKGGRHMRDTRMSRGMQPERTGRASVDTVLYSLQMLGRWILWMLQSFLLMYLRSRYQTGETYVSIFSVAAL